MKNFKIAVPFILLSIILPVAMVKMVIETQAYSLKAPISSVMITPITPISPVTPPCTPCPKGKKCTNVCTSSKVLY